MADSADEKQELWHLATGAGSLASLSWAWGLGGAQSVTLQD